jgi:hypothetical protein
MTSKETKKLPKQTGDELEKAVKEIESHIIRINPSFKNTNIKIEKNKILIVNNVKHEIDIYIEMNHGFSYNSIFIFECKNWKKSVGKNEIIQFEKKIDVTHAQKGFFIAKSFGKYAKAEAENHGKIILLQANEINLNSIFWLKNFHAVYPHNKDLDTKVELEMHDGICNDPSILNTGDFLLKNKKIDFKNYVFKKVGTIFKNKSDELSSGNLPEGENIISVDQTISVLEDGIVHTNFGQIVNIRIKFTFKYYVVYPKLISAFYIENRGRYFELSTEIPHVGTINYKFTSTT